MGFSDIIGHTGVREILDRAVERQRLHHAYLFAGPEGVGKERVAIELFRRLNCRTGPERACGQCSACRKIEADAKSSRAPGNEAEVGYTFPDLMILRPQGRFTKIEQVRDVLRRVPYAPMEGRWKCVLIRDAHRLHETAANALLKTLEEPPKDTMFVLCTHAPHLLLQTIVSRCQPMRFGALSRADVHGYLVKTASLTDVDAAPLAAMAEGSIGRALELLENPVVQRRTEWLKSVQALTAEPDHRLLDRAEELAAERGNLGLYLSLLRSWLRDQLLLLEGVSEDLIANVDLAPEAKRAAASNGRAFLLQGLQIIDETEWALEGNAPPLLAMERLFLKLFRP